MNIFKLAPLLGGNGKPTVRANLRPSATLMEELEQYPDYILRSAARCGRWDKRIRETWGPLCIGVGWLLRLVWSLPCIGIGWMLRLVWRWFNDDDDKS